MNPPFAAAATREEIIARVRAFPLGDDPAAQRAAFEHLTLGSAGHVRETITVPGSGGTIVYFHGGGYVFGSPQTHRRIGAGLAERTGLAVVLPDYPLAPEHPWPAPRVAAMAAVADLDGPVVLAGDSAGGHLALVTALAMARCGSTPAGLVLFSPNTDRSGLSRTRRRSDDEDPVVNSDADRELARQSFRAMPADEPEVSPLLADLAPLPATHIEVGSDEVLLDDSLLLADRMMMARVPVSLHVDPIGLHMMQLWAPWWPPASQSLDRAAAFIRSVLTKEPHYAQQRR